MPKIFQLTLLGMLTVASLLQAEAIRQPPSLNSGEQYRLAFVTSEGRSAESEDIESYNDFVQAVADAAPIGDWGLEWKAIASTETVSARENTSTYPVSDPSVPIFLLDGTLLAPSYARLWNAELETLRWPFDVNEFGEGFFSVESPILGVWTGTGPDGLPSLLNNGEGGPLGAGSLSINGLADNDNSSSWFFSSGSPHHHELRMYGLSNVLTAVPEPTGILHSSILLASLSTLRKRSSTSKR